MKIGKYMILVIFLVSFRSLMFCSSIDTTSIIDNIYNYDFIRAAERLSGLSESDPLRYNALNLEVKWWMAMERKDGERFSDFLKTLDQFELAEQSDLSSIISSTYRIRFYACTNKNYMIPILFLKVRRKIDAAENSILKSDSADEQELFVLYKSFLELIQNSYSVSGLFAGNSTKELLIDNLETLVRNGSYSNRTIGRYFLMKYYLDIERNKPRALSYLTELHNQYPKNLIFSQLLTNK